MHILVVGYASKKVNIYIIEFTDLGSFLRINDNFRQRIYEDHHVENSPFEFIDLKMVTQFSLDYMHLCCLGVMKKMFILHARQGCRLTVEIKQLSNFLVTLSTWILEKF